MPQTYPSFTTTYHNTPYPALSASAEGKVVVVTGGGRGIGRAISIAFAAAGARAVVILGRTLETLESTKKEIHRQHPVTVVEEYVADIVDPAAVQHVFKDVIAKFGAIHVLVLNAGYASEYNTIAGSRLEDYWYLFEVNVKGPLIATKEFLKTVAPIYSSQLESPTIVNITSGAAHLRYLRGFSAYSAAKLATIKAMEYVHLETPWARVFNLQPGIINTDMLRKAQRIKKEAEDDITLPAAVCVWLTSEKSEFLRGRMIWANWDVEELKAKEAQIVEQDLLRIDLKGWDGSNNRNNSQL